jgi:hypothetical protein
MSAEVEAVGAAATAGLVASAIDGSKSRRKRKPPSGPCANCGAELTGSYCANCGQPAQLHHALLNMVEEFVRSLVLFDTRAWKTLGMAIFRPGTLTYQYMNGKRARYISPLAMFLLCVFAMFAIFAFTGGSQIGVGNQASRVGPLTELVVDAESDLKDVNEALAELRQAGAAGGEIESEQLKADIAKTKVDKLRAALQAAQSSKGPVDAAVIESEVTGEGITGQGSVYEEIKAANESGEVKINTGWPALDDQIRHALENPELAAYKVQNAAYKFAFLLVPISLPLVWLMFMWRRDTTLFGHAVYILYSLSFVSILFMTFALLALISGALDWLAAPLLIAGPVHSFFHLKGGYGLGWFSAAWRLPFQLFFSLIGLVIFILVIIALGVMG